MFYNKCTRFSLLFSLILIILLTGCSPDNSSNKIILTENSLVQFASVERAKELLAIQDNYINEFSLFDLESKIPSETKTTDEYIRIAQESVREWNPRDIKMVTNYLQVIIDEMQAMDVNIVIPERIYLINSTCEEEGGAGGYTRENFIVFNRDAIDLNLVAHELFHIISRYNPEKIERIYASIGFTPLEDVVFPELLANNIITNPDATNLNYVINVNYQDVEKQGVLLMYSPSPYEGGSFFQYMKLGFYFLESSSEFQLSDMVGTDSVSGFYEQIGRNTGYIIHPEEISAEHFRILMTDADGDHDNPEFIEALKVILAEW